MGLIVTVGMTKTVAAFLFCSIILGCATSKPKPAPSQKVAPTDLGHWFEEGDVIEVRTVKGHLHVFRILEIRKQNLLGLAGNRKRYVVPYKNIAYVQLRHKSSAGPGESGDSFLGKLLKGLDAVAGQQP